MTPTDNETKLFATIELDCASCGGVGGKGVTPDVGKIPLINTRFSSTVDGNEGGSLPQVTPNDSGAPSTTSNSFRDASDEHKGEGKRTELDKALWASLVWRRNKDKKEEQHPHPIKALLGTYVVRSLKETICCKNPNLRDLFHIKKIENYPLCMRLFLCSLAFMLCGLPSCYTIDPWDLLAKTWCNNCSSEEMKDACTQAIDAFLNLDAENMCTERCNRMLNFMQKFKCSLNCKPETWTENDPLPKYLEETYKDKKTPFFKDVFGRKPKANSWDINMKMFLFAITALTSRSRKKDFALEKVAGYTRKQYDKLKPDALLKAVPNIISANELINPDALLKAVVIPTDDSDGGELLIPDAHMTAIPAIVPTNDCESEDLTETKTPEPAEELRFEGPLSWEETNRIEDELVVKIMDKRLAMQDDEISPMLHQMIGRFTNRNLENSKANNISTVSFKSRRNQTIEKDWACIPRPTKAFRKLGQSGKKKKTNLTQAIIDLMVGLDPEDQEEYFLLLSNNFPGLVTLRKEDFMWSDAQLGLILNLLGSANKVVKLDQIERHLKHKTRFPPQLKKRLSKLGSAERLPIKSEMVPLEMNASKEVKPQLSWRIVSPIRALEQLAEASFLSRKFIHSQDFSSKTNKVVYAFGADKDTNATSMLIRCVNRKDGNSSEHVVTLAMYDKAAENHENMAKTILKEGSSTQRCLQFVLDNKLWILTFNSIDEEGNIVGSQCFVLNLFEDHRTNETDERMLTEMDVRLERCEDKSVRKPDFKVVTSCKDFEDFENFENDVDDEITVDEEDADNSNYDEQLISTVTTAFEDANDTTTDHQEEENSFHDEDEAAEVAPSPGMECIGLKFDEEWKNKSNCLSLQLVFEGDSYYGYRIFLNNLSEGKLLVAGLFKKPISMDHADIDCAFRQAIGFVSCDKKNSWATMGMMESSSSNKNCIHCTQSKGEYKTNLPDWMVSPRCEYACTHKNANDMLDTKVAKGLKDCPSRCGQYSNPIMYRDLQAAINNGNNTYSDATLQRLREKHGCVVNKPLLDIHPSKQTFGPLHNGAGMENHFKNNIDEKMAEIDEMKNPGGTETWLEKVEDVKGRCKHIVKTYKPLLKDLKIESNAIQRNIRSYRSMIDRNTNKRTRCESVADEDVQSMREVLHGLVVEKERIDSEHGIKSRLKKGAATLQKSIETYLGSKKAKGPAQWAFRKAIEMAGPRFNPQFGGMDLSHAHGLLMLEQWSTIVDMTCGAYESDRMKSEMVKQEMRESTKIATPLFKMNTLLKSQQKFDMERIDQLKSSSCHLFFNWLEFFDQGVFPKLHDAVWHIPEFVVQNRMYGILSEESFESRHILQKKTFSVVSSVAEPTLRANVFSSRVQLPQNPDYAKVKAELDARTTKKQRGQYKKHSKESSIPILQSTELKMDGNNICIDKTMSIEKDMCDAYDYCVSGIVPKSWSEIFGSRNDLDRLQKEKARHSSQV